MSKQNQNVEQALRRIRRQFPDSEAVFNRVYETMCRKANDRCNCDVPIPEWHVRVPGKFKYRCLRCRNVISPLSVTPLGRQHKDLTDTIELACRFYYKRRVLKPSEISQLYNCQYRTAMSQSRRTLHWMKLAIMQNGDISENISNTKVIRMFVSKHDDFTSAMDALFHALPSLGEAIEKSSK